MLRIVRVRFNTGSQHYSYYVPEGDQPKAGDFVITSFDKSQMDIHHMDRAEPKFARVLSVHNSPDGKAKKTYLMLVSEKELLARKEENLRIVEREEERRAAREKLKEMLAEGAEMSLFEKLAADNPEAAKLLAVLKG